MAPTCGSCSMPQGEPREELHSVPYVVPKGSVPQTPPLPFFSVPLPPMRLFDPARDKFSARDGASGAPEAENAAGKDFGHPSPLPLFLAAKASREVLIPRVEDCHALWDKYAMPAHIRAHSERVAHLASGIAEHAKEMGVPVQPELVMAAGLLHDLGKIYCITNGGNHAQLGASWVMHETRNGAIARAVLFHVHWPWDNLLDTCLNNDDFFATMAIIYADKRVTHDAYASLDERFADLQARYGFNDYARSRIELSRLQGQHVETVFSRRLGVPLNEYTAGCGRLVKRA